MSVVPPDTFANAFPLHHSYYRASTFLPEPLDTSASPHSLLNNSLGESVDVILSTVSEMPQIITLCGIQPEQTDIDLQNHGLDAADAKLLAFDLSKNRTVRMLKYAAAPKCSPFCQRPLTHL